MTQSTLGANLHVYPSPMVNESRIFKETRSVAEAGIFSSVIICGVTNSDLPTIEELGCGRRIERVGAARETRPPLVWTRIISQLSWALAVLRRFKGEDIAAVNAHSVAVLPLCLRLARRHGARLIYDTHELETKTLSSHGLQGKIFTLIERRIIRHCDAVYVVNNSIALWYRDTYPGIEPIVIRNVPDLVKSPEPRPIRQLLGVPDARRLFIHVGNLTQGRSIDNILEVFASPEVLDYVVFLGDGTLAPMVREFAGRHENIHWLTPVSPQEVVDVVAGCDVGLCIITADELSYRLSLPNKALEYAIAGVPYFYTDLPEVAKFLGSSLGDWQIGQGAAALGEAVRSLSGAKVESARRELARLHLPTWNSEAKTMISAYRRLFPEVRT